MTEIYKVISVLSQGDFEVTQLCDTLEVSRTAFYDWKQVAPNLYQRQDQNLQPMIHR